MSIFLLFILLLIIFLINFDAKQCVTNNIILGVTLPLDKIKDVEVLNILNEYKRRLKKCLIIEILLSFLIIVLYEYFSIMMIYFISLIFISYIINFFLIKKYNLKMKKLKEENNWIVGEKNIISIDTQLILLKDKMVLPKLFFIPIFLFSLIIFLVAFLNLKEIPEILYLSINNLIFILVFFSFYLFVKTLKTKIYSENSEINITLNKYKKHLLTKFIVITSYIFVFISLIGVFIIKDNPNNISIYFILFILFIIIFVIMFYHFYNNIKDTEKHILLLDKSPILLDEDDYWRYGIFYYNPNNRNKFIEQRIGIGLTYNIPYKLNYSINIGIIIFSLLFIFSIVPLEFSNIKLYEKDNILNIKFPMYSTKIQKDDINNIYIIDSGIKINNRLNGYAGEDKAVGKFRVSIKGDQDIYKIFINLNNKDKAILIDLKENNDILLNGQNNEETERFINIIENFIK